ncbi:F-type H+-transporting ATPase subunit gamma [Tistlia consotensis]|uniref:F-type H+-transporting ATPase subunit gamma n=1 Tax=Tistlia consotensis USBA 355 TaxID=560819 RepID=A0A1Y6CQ10_9PROT|nr:F0F1 ATP synthase subunit gamma [Tistlia consotensis]SMF81333.1 F-type H+-transporting ATPase subunit gamma [Tistlia consotensis USBA 355]SNS22887.1 F-type H+-transporting ATPase subunit gamma [Tistlia consotensis]
MTGRLADLEARIASIKELHDMVTAMRGMAAARREQARGALAGISVFADTILTAFGEALPLLPAPPPAPDSLPPGPRALVLFLAEQGFVGTFNEPLVEAALDPAPPAALFVVGTRGGQLAAQRGLPADWSAAMPSHLPLVARSADRIAEALFRRLAEGDIAAVEMLHARSQEGGLTEVVRERLFPVDPALARPAASAVPPLVNLPAGRLVERIAEAWVGAELTRALVEALAAENAARVAAMQQAARNIEEKIDGLERDARSLRQSEITTELLDVVVGSEAANGGE